MAGSERRRRGVATATTGTVLTFGGGVLRHQGVRAAHEGQDAPAFRIRRPIETHPVRALVRRGAKGRGRYVLGASAGLLGAPAMAVGYHEARKRDEHHNLLIEGIEGTREATKQRAASMRETPPRHRVGPLALATAGGAVGSLAAHRGMDRLYAFQGGRHHGGRAGIAATVGAAAAASTFPLARHTVRSNDYEVTPAGVRRRKKPVVRPSSKAKISDARTMSRGQFRRETMGKVYDPHQLGPSTSRGTTRKVHWMAHGTDHAVCGLDGAFGRGTGPFAEHYGEVSCSGCLRAMRIRKDDYLGRHVSRGEQRAKTMAAGAIPGIPFAGPVAAAHMAGHYAPPGGQRKAEARQLASSAATTATGVGGAYLAAGNKRAGEQALRLHHGLQRAGERVTRPIRGRTKLRAPGGARVASVKARGTQSAERALARSGSLRRAVRPLRANKPAAIAGYIAGTKLTGTAYQNIAISRNQAAQRRYNLKHPVEKAAPLAPPSKAEQRRRIERKRRATSTQILTSSLGVSGAGMGALLLPGVRGHLRPRTAEHIQRAALGTGLAAGGISGVHGIRSARLQRRELAEQEHQLASKADHREPLTRMREQDAHPIVHRYGTAGPLPKELSREDRMRAYEARYVHAGGHKAEHWQRRADVADKVKTGGLAGATAGTAAIVALRSRRLAARLGAHRSERALRAAETATLSAGAASGGGELYAGHARRKRSSYSNSKAGVAASALRRMRDYSG